MTDTELDQILNTWTSPPAPSSLRRNVCPPGKPPFRLAVHWKAVFAGALIALLAIVLTVAQAVPQNADITWTVDSEFLSYAIDGTPSVDFYATMIERNGREMVISRTFPDQPVRTLAAQAVDFVGRLIVAYRFRDAPEHTTPCPYGKTEPGEIILGYPTVVQVSAWGHSRVTLWLAPGLQCYPLRTLLESQNTDGTWRLRFKRQALKINIFGATEK